jgi:membrane protease YdiL (CAAX protease family)
VIPAVEAGTGARQGERSATALLAAAGVTLLMLRLLIPGNPSAGTLLAVIYLMLGIISVAAPVATNRQHALSPPVVVAIGLVALAVASLVAGPRAPLAHGAEALALSSLAAVSEEAFFRRFLYGRLVRSGPLIAIGISALLFAVVHVPAYGVAVFWVDLGAGLLLSWQRWASGGWAAPAATHVAANILAVIR